MSHSLAILALSIWVGLAVRAESTKDEIHLRATVQSVVYLGDFSGTMIPVHFDPRFALTVRIESANPAISNFRSGSVVTLAIHSPSLLFAGEAVKGKSAGEALKGKTYDFVLHRAIKNGKTRFLGLQLQRP